MNISAKRVVWTSFLVDLSDIILSLVVTLLSGSVVMFSRVLQGMVDLSASTFLVLGVRLSRRPPDKDHPFGHGREMYFWALISSLLMLFITATASFYLGWQRFLTPEPIRHLPWTFLSLGVTFITNGYAFSLSYKRLLRNYPARALVPIFFKSSLIETKTTFILDLMGTLASALGLLALGIFELTGNLRFDGLGAVAIGVMLAVFSFLLILGVKDLLVGRRAAPELEEEINLAATEVNGIERVIGVKTVYIGPESLLVVLDVAVAKDLNTSQIEKIIDEVKISIKKKVPRVSEIQVEVSVFKK